MQKRKINVGFIVIIIAVVAIGGYFLMQNSDTDNNETIGDETTATSTYQVIFDGEKFSPEIRTVPINETVTFYNETEEQEMWIASDLHPTHTAYSGTSLNEHCNDEEATPFDSCVVIQPGDYWRFTFNKIGDWSYHNHVQSSQTGMIEVK